MIYVERDVNTKWSSTFKVWIFYPFFVWSYEKVQLQGAVVILRLNTVYLIQTIVNYYCVLVRAAVSFFLTFLFLIIKKNLSLYFFIMHIFALIICIKQSLQAKCFMLSSLNWSILFWNDKITLQYYLEIIIMSPNLNFYPACKVFCSR